MMIPRPVLSPTRVTSSYRGIGASADFTDGVVGDLLEEFAEREVRDGTRAAQRWFAREALRNLPAAVADAWRVLRWRDARALINHALLACLLVAIAAGTGVMLVVGALRGLGVPLEMPAAAVCNPLWALTLLPVVVAEALAMGYVAAWLDRTRPLACAAVLSLGWLTAHTVMFSLESREPLWFFLSVPTVTAAAIMAGAVVRLWRRDPVSTPGGATT